MKVELTHWDISIILSALEQRLFIWAKEHPRYFEQEEWRQIYNTYLMWESVYKESFEKENEETY